MTLQIDPGGILEGKVLVAMLDVTGYLRSATRVSVRLLVQAFACSCVP